MNGAPAQSTRWLLAIAALGITAAVAQVVLLREALAASSGNEVAVVMGLTIWLLGVAVGAVAGGMVPMRWVRGAAVIAGVLATLFPLGALILSRATLQLFHIPAGELLTLGQQIAGNACALGPVCLCIGAAFSLLCRLPETPPRVVYLAEAVGWWLGGIATTWLLVSVQPVLLLLLLPAFGLPLIGVACGRRWGLVLLALFIVLFTVVLPRAGRWEQQTLAWRWPEQRLVASCYTPHGHGAILERYGQQALYVNGRLATVFGEQQSAEELAHLALLQVKAPSRVYLVGALGGLLPEVLKHPVREVTVAEADSGLARLALAHADTATTTALRDARVHLVSGDARRLASRPGYWDAIIVNVPEPATLLANRFYTVECFRALRAALRPGGVLAFALPGEENFAGAEMIARNGTVFRTLTAVFPRVAVSPLAMNYFLAADTPLCLDGAELGRRLEDRHIAALFVDSYYFAALLPPERIAEIRRTYRSQGQGLNHDLTPVAYFHHLALQQRMESVASSTAASHLPQWPPWMLGGAVAMVLLGCTLLPAMPWRRGVAGRWATLCSVAVVGCVSMALSLLLLLLAQVLLGALYHFLGLLVAAGMAGMAGGAWAVRRWSGRRLAVPVLGEAVLALGIVLFAMTASAWPFALVLLTLLVLAALSGVGVGMIFPLATAAGQAPGTVYGMDLLGAALAGPLTVVLLLPMHGLVVTGVLLALLGLGAVLWLTLSPARAAS